MKVGPITLNSNERGDLVAMKEEELDEKTMVENESLCTQSHQEHL